MAMTKEEILDTIKTLAQAQVVDRLLYANIKDNDKALDDLVSQDFKNPVDLILFIET